MKISLTFLFLITFSAEILFNFHSLIPWYFPFQGVGASDGLIYYENGAKKDKGTKIVGSYSTDAVTKMTLGKPNKGEQYFGSFQMDNLVIYYKALTSDEIYTLVTGMKSCTMFES